MSNKEGMQIYWFCLLLIIKMSANVIDLISSESEPDIEMTPSISLPQISPQISTQTQFFTLRSSVNDSNHNNNSTLPPHPTQRNLQSVQNHLERLETDSEYASDFALEGQRKVSIWNKALLYPKYQLNTLSLGDNCLDLVEQGSILLLKPNAKISPNRFEDDVDIKQCFHQSYIEMADGRQQTYNSHYLHADDNGTLNLRLRYWNISHFQNNTQRSEEYSQHDLLQEKEHLKAHSFDYKDGNLSVEDFENITHQLLLENGCVWNFSDDQLISWANLTGFTEQQRWDHILHLIYDGWHRMWYDDQLNDGVNTQVVFGSLTELFDYRRQNVTLKSFDRHGNMSLLRCHSKASDIVTAAFIPFQPTLSLKAYHFRRVTRPVWNYSRSKYNCDQWLLFKNTHCPNDSIPVWIFQNVSHNTNIFVQWIFSEALVEHEQVAYMRQEIENIQSELVPDDSTTFVYEKYHAQSIILACQSGFKQIVCQGSDDNAYRYIHADAELRDLCWDKTMPLTEAFRQTSAYIWQCINSNRLTLQQKEFGSNYFVQNPKYLNVSTVIDLPYLVSNITTDRKLNKILLPELLMKHPSAAGYDISRYSNDSNSLNFEIGNSLVNTFQDVIPSYLLMKAQVEPYIIPPEQYHIIGQNHIRNLRSISSSPYDIFESNGMITGFPVDEKNDDSNEEEKKNNDSNGDDTMTEPNAYGATDLTQTTPPPAIIIRTGRRNGIQSRSYIGPSHFRAHNTRSTILQAMQAQLNVCENLYDTKLIEDDIAWNIFQKVQNLENWVIGRQFGTTQLNVTVPFNDIRQDINIWLNNNLIQLPAIHETQIYNHQFLGQYIDIQNKSDLLHNQGYLLNHLVAYMEIIFTEARGYRVEGNSAISLRSIVSDNNIYVATDRNVKFVKQVKKYPRTFMLKYKTSAYQPRQANKTKINTLFDFLDTNKDFIQLNGIIHPPWTLQMKMKMRKWFV
eukprot:233814_1